MPVHIKPPKIVNRIEISVSFPDKPSIKQDICASIVSIFLRFYKNLERINGMIAGIFNSSDMMVVKEGE
ncbi:hypothetical protein ANBU17_22750 [Anaerostipes butyraticus]|uniref:Uncharacterized protein n=1 Tax=Anaerostipes butyraticus TaxID=645466 RepID=A0A916VE44_9FIRM|nr:hypothetical protein ANBU17_22750 [Anaerostipes butyraticus]